MEDGFTGKMIVDGVEVDVSYGFEVDSKGAVKPKFSASIHKMVGYEKLCLPGSSIEDELRRSSEILVKIAQEVLDKTPKKIEE